MWYPVSDRIATEAVTPDDVAFVLRLNSDENPASYSLQVAAARAHVEAYCNQQFAEHEMEWACDSFGDFARLPAAPVHSITRVAYVDPEGTTQDLAPESYVLLADGLDPKIALAHGARWPEIRPKSRIAVSGFFGGACPEDVKNAILLLIGAWDDRRENAAQPLWSAVDSQLSNHRRGAW